MRQAKKISNNYLWLKILIIIAVVSTAYLLLTKQYMVLIQVIVCIIGGIIAYKFIVHELKRKGNQCPIPNDTTKQEKPARATTGEAYEFNIKKIATKDLIEELSRRGEIRGM